MPSEHGDRTWPEETTADLADRVLSAARALMAMAIRTVGEGDVPVTVVQHRVLLILEEAGRLSVSDVAARLGIDQSNASRHCSRLADLGLVRRTPATHDRRAVDVRLTDAGRRQVLAVRQARFGWAERVLAELSPAEARAAVRALELFADVGTRETDR
jgi:DNA-binding MarR family transcriptional regulator